MKTKYQEDSELLFSSSVYLDLNYGFIFVQQFVKLESLAYIHVGCWLFYKSVLLLVLGLILLEMDK